MHISFHLKEKVVKICFADNFLMSWSDFRQIGARCNLLKIHIDMLLGDSTHDLRIFAYLCLVSLNATFNESWKVTDFTPCLEISGWRSLCRRCGSWWIRQSIQVNLHCTLRLRCNLSLEYWSILYNDIHINTSNLDQFRLLCKSPVKGLQILHFNLNTGQLFATSFARSDKQ